jgi:hypothetical protein
MAKVAGAARSLAPDILEAVQQIARHARSNLKDGKGKLRLRPNDQKLNERINRIEAGHQENASLDNAPTAICRGAK